MIQFGFGVAASVISVGYRELSQRLTVGTVDSTRLRARASSGTKWMDAVRDASVVNGFATPSRFAAAAVARTSALAKSTTLATNATPARKDRIGMNVVGGCDARQTPGDGSHRSKVQDLSVSRSTSPGRRP